MFASDIADSALVVDVHDTADIADTVDMAVAAWLTGRLRLSVMSAKSPRSLRDDVRGPTPPPPCISAPTNLKTPSLTRSTQE